MCPPVLLSETGRRTEEEARGRTQAAPYKEETAGMTKPLGVVCLSGGMDSCVTAAIAAETHELALLHVNYGQRTEARELWSFREIADQMGTPLGTALARAHRGLARLRELMSE